MTFLATVTLALASLGTALALWLGCYVVFRSPRSSLAWLAGLTLWSLAGLLFDFVVTLQPSPYTVWWIGWPFCTPLAVWYHLSIKTLPGRGGIQRSRYWLWLVFLLAAAADCILGLTKLMVADSRHGLSETIKIFTPGPLFYFLPVVPLGLSLMIFANFWRAHHLAANPVLRHQLASMVRATVLEALAIIYAMGAALLFLPAPTWPMLVALDLAIVSLGYGIVRYSALIEGRVLRYDFILNGVLTAAVVAFYLALMADSVMPFGAQLVIVLAIIASHSGFEFARRVLDRIFLQRREHALRVALKSAAAEVGERAGLEDGLRGSLEALTGAVEARWGLIALIEEGEPVVRATLRSLEVGQPLLMELAGLRDLVEAPLAPPAGLAGLALIAPLAVGGQTQGAILLGPPRSGAAYSERDLDLADEAAITLADLVRDARRQDAHLDELHHVLEEFQQRERRLQEEIESLRQPAGGQEPTPEQVTQIEDALRHLSDYSYLGETLPAFLRLNHAGGVSTHLERGKRANNLICAGIERLRPPGAEPRELPPREWHAYVVLRDAYVAGEANRDIMSRLYISEATFHRTRRRAVWALTKALLESETASA